MAATIVQTSFTKLPVVGPGASKYLMVLTCTAHTDGSCAVALDAETMSNLDGKYSYTVVTKPGGTAPTDNSDLAISDSRGLALMTAAGNGLNLISATLTKQQYMEGPNGDHYQLLHKAFPLTFTISNNSVSGAIVLIYLELTD